MISKYALRRDRYLEIMQNLSGKRILIVGDVGVDRYTMGTATRLSPEAPVPVVMVAEQKDKLGLAANVADNVKSFGGIPVLASLVGEDRFCEELLGLLKQNSISSELVLRHGSRRTTLKERVLAQDQQVVRIDHETTAPLGAEAESYYLKNVIPRIGDFDAIILEDYGKGLLTNNVISSIVAEATKQKIFITVDPTTSVRSPAVYKGVSLFKPNANEAERLSGIEIHDQASLHRAGKALLDAVAAPIVVITQGKAGMTLFTAKDQPVQIPTFAKSVYDVSGAGDTVISLLTLALVSGATLVEASVLANFAAGVEVGKQGTATVSPEELEHYMGQMGGLVS